MPLGSLWLPFQSGHMATTSGVALPATSVIMQVLQCVDFWILWGVHTGLFWVRDRLGQCRQNDHLCDLEKAQWREYEINVEDLWQFNALIVVLLYGYNWLCYHRLLAFFEASSSLIRLLDRVSLTLRVYCEDPEDRWNVIRYLLASLRTSKFGIQSQRAAISKDQSAMFQWEVFMRTHVLGDRLLLQEEADFLKVDGNKQEILCSWCVISMRNLLHSWRQRQNGEQMQDFSRIHEHTLVLGAVTEDTKRVRDAVSRLGEQVLFVFPSSLLPLLSIGLWADLLALGYALLFVQDGNGSYTTMLFYPVILLFLLGIRESSNAMISPLSDASCFASIDSWTDAFVSDYLLGANSPNEPFRTTIGAVTVPNNLQQGKYNSESAQRPFPADGVWTSSLEQSTKVTRQLDTTLNRLLDLLPGRVLISTQNPPDPATDQPVSEESADTAPPLPPAVADGDGGGDDAARLASAFSNDDAGLAHPVVTSTAAHASASPSSQLHSALSNTFWEEPASEPPAPLSSPKPSAQPSAGSAPKSGGGGFKGFKRSLLAEARRPHLVTAAGAGPSDQALNLGRETLLGRRTPERRPLNHISQLPGVTDT